MIKRTKMKRFLFLGALLYAVALQVVAADASCATARDGRTICPQPDAKCVNDRHGEVVCSTPGGGIVKNRYGDTVCGPGYCTTDTHGDVFCSNAPRGAAALDRYGKAACSVACVAASAQMCERPKPAS
jgi:hypothetical protein